MLVNKNIKEHFALVETTMAKCSDLKIKKALEAFVHTPVSYKNQFLQKQYNTGFDGYSFLGQKDSTNQYDTDLLHSFVISEFTKKEDFPKEFQDFLNDDWNDLVSKVKALELELIKKLNLPDLNRLYKSSIGHMMSCNFYPKVENSKADADLRLSKHKDVSLFTVFLFGMKEGFAYSNSLGEIQVLNDTYNVVVFPGYLLEYLTDGKYKALEHQVDFNSNNEARFSFAFFSLLKPIANVVYKEKHFKSETYFENYLLLF